MLIEDGSDGDTTLTVDSTIGFRDNGEFAIADGTVFKYQQKTINQFLGVTCEDTGKTISIKDEIIDDIYVTGTTTQGDTVRCALLVLSPI